jgi:hypothetical protein
MNRNDFKKDKLSDEDFLDEEEFMALHDNPSTKQEALLATSSLLQNLQDRLGLRASRGPKSLCELLVSLFNDEWKVRAEAIHGLELQIEYVPLRALFYALEDENDYVRAAAVRALGQLGEHTPKEPLLQALLDSSWRVRAAAIQALGNLGPNIPTEELVKFLNDGDSSIRAEVIAALGKSNYPYSLEIVQKALKDRDEIVRLEAGEVLKQLKKGDDRETNGREFDGKAEARLVHKEKIDSISPLNTSRVDGFISRKTDSNMDFPTPLENEVQQNQLKGAEGMGMITQTAKITDRVEQWLKNANYYYHQDNGISRPLLMREPVKDPTTIETLVLSLRQFLQSNGAYIRVDRITQTSQPTMILKSCYHSKQDSLREIIWASVGDTVQIAPFKAALNETDEAVRTVAQQVNEEIVEQPWTELLIIACDVLMQPKCQNQPIVPEKIVFCSVSHPYAPYNEHPSSDCKERKQEGREQLDIPILDQLLASRREHEGDDILHTELADLKFWYEASSDSIADTKLVGLA